MLRHTRWLLRFTAIISLLLFDLPPCRFFAFDAFAAFAAAVTAPDVSFHDDAIAVTLRHATSRRHAL